MIIYFSIFLVNRISKEIWLAWQEWETFAVFPLALSIRWSIIILTLVTFSVCVCRPNENVLFISFPSMTNVYIISICRKMSNNTNFFTILIHFCCNCYCFQSFCITIATRKNMQLCYCFNFCNYDFTLLSHLS